MHEKKCPHGTCQGIAWGYKLRDSKGNVYAIEYTCSVCGARWQEPVNK